MVEIDHELLFEAFAENAQCVADFDFSDFGREVDVLVALEEDHGYLVLPAFVTLQQSLLIDLLFIEVVHQLQFIQNMRVLG